MNRLGEGITRGSDGLPAERRLQHGSVGSVGGEPFARSVRGNTFEHDGRADRHAARGYASRDQFDALAADRFVLNQQGARFRRNL